MAHYTLEEQETIIRYDRTDSPAMLYTADPNQAERWRKLGVEVEPQGAHGWQALIPKGAVKIRRLVNGILPQRVMSENFIASRGKKKQASTASDIPESDDTK